MTDAERNARLAEVLRTEYAGGKLGWYYLSFADGTRPKGTQFLGAAIVEGYGLASAIRQSHKLGVNPGGEVLGGEWPVDRVPLPDAKFLNRLLSKEEAESL